MQIIYERHEVVTTHGVCKVVFGDETLIAEFGPRLSAVKYATRRLKDLVGQISKKRDARSKRIVKEAKELLGRQT